MDIQEFAKEPAVLLSRVQTLAAFLHDDFFPYRLKNVMLTNVLDLFERVHPILCRARNYTLDKAATYALVTCNFQNDFVARTSLMLLLLYSSNKKFLFSIINCWFARDYPKLFETTFLARHYAELMLLSSKNVPDIDYELLIYLYVKEFGSKVEINPRAQIRPFGWVFKFIWRHDEDQCLLHLRRLTLQKDKEAIYVSAVHAYKQGQINIAMKLFTKAFRLGHWYSGAFLGSYAARCIQDKSIASYYIGSISQTCIDKHFVEYHQYVLCLREQIEEY